MIRDGLEEVYFYQFSQRVTRALLIKDDTLKLKAILLFYIFMHIVI